jgi:hypothetical protein
MISTTTAYQTAVGATKRKTKGRVVFEITDTTAKGDLSSLTVTGEADFSKKAQTYDEVRDMAGKYATFENDYWLADDSFHLTPKFAESGFQVGWWNSELSGSDGSYLTETTVTQNTGNSNTTIFLLNERGQRLDATFTANINQINYVDVYVPTRVGSPTKIKLEIYDETAASSLGSKTLLDASITVGGFVRFTFDSPISCTPGNVLQIRVGTDNTGDASNYYTIRRQLSDVQANSFYIRTTDAWSTKTDDVTFDLMFVLNYSTGNIQEALYTFTADHSSIGISITFDKLAGVVAEDFTIQALDSSDVEIDSISVTGNTSSVYVWNQTLDDYRKIKISVTKMSEGYRRLRITEVDFGIIETYEGDTLINMNVLEEVDPTSSEVTTNEMKFTIENQDKRFDILNPTGIYSYLQRKQQIFGYIGIEISTDTFEYVPCGVYYLSDWQSDRGTLTASFTARDILEQLGESLYRKATTSNITLKNLIDDIMSDAGVTDYTLDSSLTSITVKGYIPIVSHREALQMCAVAGECIIYSDRDGTIQIKPVSASDTGVTIGLDNMYNSPKINLDKLINTIEVNNYTFTSLASEQLYNGTINLNGTSDVWFDYSKPATSVSAVVGGLGTLNSATYYTNSAKLNITSTGDATVTITGTEIAIGNNVVTDVDPSIATGEKTLTMKVENTLINDTARAESVAAWLLDEVGNRNLYDIDWRQDPRLEAGDIVTVEDEYSQDLTARITKQEFEFNGALSGRTDTKGGNL